MEVRNRIGALVRAGGTQKTLWQPTPRLRRTGEERLTSPPLVTDNAGGGETQGVRDGSPFASSLLHLVDLRRRYREEAATMRSQLVVLQAKLEDSSRHLCYTLTSGLAAPAKLRARCDDLAEAVEQAERDLADAHLAIDSVGREITALVAVRQRTI